MKPATRNDLTPEESQRRAEIEPQIKRNIKNCIETGALLREMSDRRLYRNTHSTFKEYVEEVYGIAVRTAYELVDHADVIGSLPDECANFAQTATPSQTRVLKKVPAEKRANVIKDAKAKADSEGKDLTASHIKDAADTEVMPDQETPEQNTANRDGSCADTQARPVFVLRFEKVIECLDSCKSEAVLFQKRKTDCSPGALEDLAFRVGLAQAAILSEAKRMKEAQT